MKKGLIAGAIVVVATLAISPKYIATEVNKALQHNVSQINQLPGYELEISELKQSWFNTQSVITVKMALPGMQDSETQYEGNIPEFEVNLNINHGPLLLSNLGVVGVADWTATVDGQTLREHITWPEDTPIYRIQGVTGLTGNSSYQDNITAFTGKQNQPLATINFSGYIGSGDITGGEIRYHGLADSFTLHSNELDIDSKKLAITLQAEANFAIMLRGEFYNSDALLSLEKLHVAHKALTQPIDLNGLKLRAQSQIDQQNNTGSIALDYRLATINVPEFNANDLQLAMQVNQIDIDFLKEYQKFARTLGATDAEQVNQATQKFMLDNLLMLLMPGPELNITRFKGTLAQGDFNGHLNSKLVNIDSLPENIADKGFWIQHTLADAQLQIDKEVAELLAARQMLAQLKTTVPPQQWDDAKMQQLAQQQAPLILENLAKQGLLSKTEDGYQAVFNLEDGEATLNGRPMPLPQ